MRSADRAPRGRAFWRSEEGIAFYPQLIIAVLVLMVVSTALVKNIYQAHQVSINEYRRMRVLEELQSEMEYWKSAVYIYGVSAPRPDNRHYIAIDTGNRRVRDYVIAEFNPSPEIRVIRGQGVEAYEITVSITWPEGKVMRRETLRTAVNQLR